MTTYLRPPLVSEIEPNGDVENCVPDSVVMAAIAAGHVIPATNAEGDKLRALAGYGPEGGTTVERITAVAKSRYGTSFQIVATWPAFRAALVAGRSAAVIGKPSATPIGGPFRRFYPAFPGLHCDWVSNEGGRLWLIDPRGQAPYRGEAVTWAQLEAFFVGSAGLLPLKILTTGKAMACGANVRPDAKFGAPVGKIAAGATFETNGTVVGLTWTRVAGCVNPQVPISGTKWYRAVSIGGKPISALYPGHSVAYLYAGGVRGG